MPSVLASALTTDPIDQQRSYGEICGLATFIIRVFLTPIMKRYTEAQILTGGIFIAAVAFFLFPFFSNAYMLGAIAFLLLSLIHI